MLGNSLNDLSKFYGGNSFNHKSLRVSHLEKAENSSEGICHSSGPSSLHHKNLNDKKLDMSSALKKSSDEHGNKVSGHYIFQQHLNQKSQTPYEKTDLKSKDKNTIKTSTSDLKHRDNIYQSHSPYQYSHLLSKNSIDPTYQMKMLPPMLTNMPTVHSPPSNFGAKQLSKLKRFLTTLQQFAVDISPETGERVRALVLNLVNSVISIEEFHSKLQEATNFPLRPFVIPFLKANLPLLQYELLNFTRLSKLNTSEYLNQSIENFLFSDNTLQNNPSPTEYPGGEFLNNKLKRKSPDNESIIQSSNKKHGQNMPLLYISSPNSHGSGSMQNQGLPAPPPIRPRPSPPHQHIPQIPMQHHPGVHFPVANLQKQSYANHIPNFMNSQIPNSSSPKNFIPVSNSFYPNHHSSSSLTFNPTSSQPNQLATNPTSCTINQAGLLMTNQMNGKNLSKQDDNFLNGKDKHFNYYMKEFEQDFNEALNTDVFNMDFKNIDTMLNSIFDMVEKTQKILNTVHSKAQKLKKQKEFYENELKRIAEPNDEQFNINESKKKSNKDDTIFSKSNDQSNRDVEKCDDNLKESNQNECTLEKCWNCGRRGIETCSKCSQTKFCSPFCKNKHFEIKHYKQFDLENVKIEKLNEKENEISNDLLTDTDLVENQEKKNSKEEESPKNEESICKNQQDNIEIKE